VELEFPPIGFDPVRLSCCYRSLFPCPAELDLYSAPRTYDLSVYTAKDVADLEGPTNYVLLAVVRMDGQLVFGFKGYSQAQRIVFGEHPAPSCVWEDPGIKETPLQPHPTGDQGKSVYFDIPDDSGWEILCKMQDRIEHKSFQRRAFTFAMEPRGLEAPVGTLPDSVSTPILVNLDRYEVMSDSHFTADDGLQINSTRHMMKPGEAATIEWTSAREENREVYLLVLVGAFVALAACTFIEAIRFWLLLWVRRATAEDDTI